MSDCYLTFNIHIPLEDDVADEVCKLLVLADKYHGVDEDEQQEIRDALAPVFSEFAEYEELGFDWQIHLNALCLDADENGNTEHATELLKWLLPKTTYSNLGFSYAEYGGGENGGGAVRVFNNGSKVEVEYMNTDFWLKSVMR